MLGIPAVYTIITHIHEHIHTHTHIKRSAQEAHKYTRIICILIAVPIYLYRILAATDNYTEYFILYNIVIRPFKFTYYRVLSILWEIYLA